MATDPRYAQAYFTVGGIPELVELLVNAQIRAAADGYLQVEIICAELARNITDDLNVIASAMALLADKEIVAKISETRATNRPPAFEMEGHIHSQSTGLGFVAVALTEELDKIVNPVGDYGTFWRAQEYGTGQTNEGGAIPTQIGRVFLGAFEPSSTRPDLEQAGLGVGTDAKFISRRAQESSGGDQGFGTINEDLPARHFIRDGSAIAGVEYARRMAELDAKYGRRVEDAIELIRRTFTTGRGFTGLIEA